MKFLKSLGPFLGPTALLTGVVILATVISNAKRWLRSLFSRPPLPLDQQLAKVHASINILEGIRKDNVKRREQDWLSLQAEGSDRTREYYRDAMSLSDQNIESHDKQLLALRDEEAMILKKLGKRSGNTLGVVT